MYKVQYHEITLKNWVKLNVVYVGQSKKHAIFQNKRWENSLERILKRPIFNESYEQVGHISDIFGPVKTPFISVKLSVQKEQFDPHDILYVKMN